MSMSILYVFPDSKIGGAEKAALIIADELISKYNVRVSILFLNSSVNLKLNSKIRQFYFKKRKKTSKVINYFFIKPFFFLKILVKNNFDFVLSGYEYDSEPLFLFIKPFIFFKGTKFITIIQASLKGRKQDAPLVKKNVFKILDLTRPLVFDKIIIVSNLIKNELNRTSLNKVNLIPNPLDKNIYKLKNKKIDKRLETIVEKPYILSISRIALQKNLFLLLKSFSLISSKINENLIIVGNISDNTLHNKLLAFIDEHQLDNRVYLIDSVENVYPLIKQAKIIVHTAFYEGFPLAILEAMYLKKIIVSTKFVGSKELLSPQNSFLCNSFVEYDFSQLLLRVLNNKKDTNILLNNAYRKAILYNAEKISQKYYQLFQKCK